MRGEEWSAPATAALRGCLDQGMSIGAISHALGIKYHRVRDKIRTLRRPMKKHRAVHHTNPATHYKPRGDKVWERRCLCCGHVFRANSPWLRLCPEDRGKG